MTQSSQPVLITGATGFLGSWIIARLVENGVRVIASDISDNHHRLDALMPGNLGDMVDFEICDVTDSAAIAALVAQAQPSAIIHLAALQIPQCRANPSVGALVNVVGHVNIFEAAHAHGTKRVIYTSSIAAKPRGPDNAPSNLYGVYKKTSEEIARIFWQDHKVPSLGLRPYIVYGVGREDGETSAFTKAMRAAALGEPYEISFKTRSCFQYVGDVAGMFTLAAVSDWDGALLSDLTDKVLSTDDIVDVIKAVVPGAQITSADDIRVSPSDGFDTKPLHEVIGDYPESSPEQGIRETIALFRRINAQ